MLEKARQGKHGGHPTYSHNGTATKITGSHSQTSGGENTTSCCTTGSPWRSTSAKATRAERIQIANNWILTANSAGITQVPLNQRPRLCSSEKRMQTIT